MILNGKMINPGELRTEISLQEPTASVTTGFQKENWTAYKTVKAKWNNAHGSEAWTALGQGASAPATALIRYESTLRANWSVVKGSDRWRIVSVDDIGERHEWMELKLVRWVSG